MSRPTFFFDSKTSIFYNKNNINNILFMGAKISRDILPQRTENHEQPIEEDYDQRVVRKFIRTGRLAPCYEGLANPTPSEETVKIEETPRITVHKYPFIPWELPARRSTPPSDTDQIIECPICLSYYPIHDVNYSRCCHQPICTECFLRMKRSLKTPLKPATCPFCVQPDFGVVYIPAPDCHHHKDIAKQRKVSLWSGSSAKRKSYSWDDPNVVLVDDIRPNWHLLMARGPEKSLSGVGSTRRQLVRPNEEAPSRSGNIRTWDSPYYERQVNDRDDWTADENTAVMDAIRGSSSSSNSTTNSSHRRSHPPRPHHRPPHHQNNPTVICM
ncbi:hypothetical protein BDA99DRAFT_75995 [Phascolomyces articulosus]|uniref:RING-type domain-containing protein n=1 Tax=Phascolomyces articulosus TaxID=60185 RepID=A0AAD5PD15_9FUNG|nr:hypothetical protein BDA99DRAFT_75995 [Phascolomyces articulosus]